ncbi:type VI immunity family protein [Rhizobacter sp. P5_C2]
MEEIGVKELDALRLQLKMRSGEYCVARTGVTLVLYYGKSMRDMVAPLTRLLDAYSGEPSHVGEYGFHFFGTDLSSFDVSPREACSCMFEFPLSMLNVEHRERFESFVAEICDAESFESGYAGYAFEHLTRSWRDQALAWIAQKAPRFLGFDISYDSFSAVARRRVVNVSWITLLGHPLIKELGGEAQIRSQLSPEIRLRSLATGLVIVTGDVPPIGDVSRGAQDLQLPKEVAALTRPVRAALQIGFGSQAFRRYWPNRLD